MQKLIVLVGLVAMGLGLGCAGGEAPSGCGANDACAGGEVCRENRCVKLCNGDLECDADVCCAEGVCAGSCSGRAAPVITMVDSDGPADEALGHAGHQLGSRLVVHGSSFDGAVAYLSGPGLSERALAACSATTDRLEVELPGEISQAGNYQLRVANQAGACEATLPMLQGQAGAQGAPGAPGAEGPQGPQGAPGQTWTVGAGLTLASTTLSADPAYIIDTAVGASFLRLDDGVTPQSGSFRIDGSGLADTFNGNTGLFGSVLTSGTVSATGGVSTGGQYAWSTARCGAENLGAVDFQPTVTAATTVVREYDDFGSSTAGVSSKIGARLHPYNGATWTELACWFQTTSSGNPSATVTGTLWRVPLGGGNVYPYALPLASVALSGAAPTTGPTRVSTTSFAESGIVTYDGATGYTYLVELSFPNFSYPTFKANGCTVRWCASEVAP